MPLKKRKKCFSDKVLDKMLAKNLNSAGAGMAVGPSKMRVENRHFFY